MSNTREEQALIWDYYKPRHTHAWNMLVLSWRGLDQQTGEAIINLETEYFWENFIIRLWLYRTTVKTLAKLDTVRDATIGIVKTFDASFEMNGQNGLKAIRDMIEHFDDYAAGHGRGPAVRDSDLDPWRAISQDKFERGRFALDRAKSYEAAINLRSEARRVSDDFIHWYNSSG